MTHVKSARRRPRDNHPHESRGGFVPPAADLTIDPVRSGGTPPSSRALRGRVDAARRRRTRRPARRAFVADGGRRRHRCVGGQRAGHRGRLAAPADGQRRCARRDARCASTDLRPEFGALAPARRVTRGRRGAAAVPALGRAGVDRPQDMGRCAQCLGFCRLRRRIVRHAGAIDRAAAPHPLAGDPAEHRDRRVRRAAHHRPAVVPDGHRHRLPGRRPAAALRREHLRRRSRRHRDAARAVAADDRNHRRRTFGLRVHRANRHDEGHRGDRCAADGGHRAAGVARAAEDARADRRPAAPDRLHGRHRRAGRDADGAYAARRWDTRRSCNGWRRRSSCRRT